MCRQLSSDAGTLIETATRVVLASDALIAVLSIRRARNRERRADRNEKPRPTGFVAEAKSGVGEEY